MEKETQQEFEVFPIGAIVQFWRNGNFNICGEGCVYAPHEGQLLKVVEVKDMESNGINNAGAEYRLEKLTVDGGGFAVYIRPSMADMHRVI